MPLRSILTVFHRSPCFGRIINFLNGVFYSITAHTRFSDPSRQNHCHVAVRVQNSDDLQGFRCREVDNQVRIDGEKPDFGVGQVAPPVSPVRKIRKVRELAADHGFHAVGSLLTAFLPDVTPDFYEVAGCLWRQDIAPLHSG